MPNEKIIFNNIKKIDSRTDYGKGFYFKGDDGKEYSTMDEVRAANKRYWDRMKVDTTRQDSMISYIGKDGREYHTNEYLERANKAYFDYIKATFNLYDSHLSEIALNAQLEKILAYIHERSEDYFEKELQKYGLENLNNRDSKKL